MSKPFDTSGKTLLEVAPEDWLTFLGFPRSAQQVSIVDANLSTVSTSADKVIEVLDAEPWILHVEFQSNHDSTIHTRLMSYNVLLQHRHQKPVSSVVVLMAKEANTSKLTGRWFVKTPLGPPWEFAYNVMKVWEVPAQQFLQGPTALVPLALIANVPQSDLRQTVKDLVRRLQGLPNQALADQLLATAFILCNLRYDKMTIQQIMSDVEAMKEIHAFNIMYEEGLEEGVKKGREEGRVLGENSGVLKEARAMLLRLGRRKFGEPATSVQDEINAIQELAKLEELAEQVLTASSWSELFP